MKDKYNLQLILKLQIIFLLLCVPVLSQPVLFEKSKIVVVNTSGERDDLRAISLLRSIPEIEIKAVIFNGDNSAMKNVNKFLSGNHLPVVASSASGETLSQIIHSSGEKIVIICLGEYKNIAKCIEKDNSLIPGIERIILYRYHQDAFNPGEHDEEIKKFADTGVRIEVISDLEQKKVVVDISKNRKRAKAAGIPVSNNTKLQLFSELAAIYFAEPELFDVLPVPRKINLRFNTDYDVPSVKDVFGDMLNGTYYQGSNIVFSRFPDKKEMFKYDVRHIMDSVISKYGYEEWEACVMTDEFHGHLGVYSIVGAKMGIKARELFGAGPDVLKVLSYAGSKPPYSCLNDGIQVSTGSTLGMGLISLAQADITRSQADFTYNNKTIRLSLKIEYLEQVEADIKEGIVKFGLMDEGYWKMVRRAAIKYWLEWDRDKIFEIREVH